MSQRRSIVNEVYHKKGKICDTCKKYKQYLDFSRVSNPYYSDNRMDTCKQCEMALSEKRTAWIKRNLSHNKSE